MLGMLVKRRGKIGGMLEEPAELGSGGSHESRPQRIRSLAQGSRPLLNPPEPATAGAYHLFAQVFYRNDYIPLPVLQPLFLPGLILK